MKGLVQLMLLNTQQYSSWPPYCRLVLNFHCCQKQMSVLLTPSLRRDYYHLTCTDWQHREDSTTQAPYCAGLCINIRDMIICPPRSDSLKGFGSLILKIGHTRDHKPMLATTFPHWTLLDPRTTSCQCNSISSWRWPGPRSYTHRAHSDIATFS